MKEKGQRRILVKGKRVKLVKLTSFSFSYFIFADSKSSSSYFRRLEIKLKRVWEKEKMGARPKKIKRSKIKKPYCKRKNLREKNLSGKI
jgi:hypothetical protein